jgi:type III secretory pathway component EscV
VKAMKVASDLLLVLAVLLVVVAIVQAVKALIFVAAAALVGSVAFTVAKRRTAKGKRSH